MGDWLNQKLYKLGYKLGAAAGKNSGPSKETRSNRTKVDYVYFGRFPQKIKDDSVSLGASLGGGLWQGSDRATYCERIPSGKDGQNGSAGNFSYAAKWHTSALNTSVSRYTNGKQQGRYFKLQPIKWYVINDVGGTLTLLSERILFYAYFHKNRSMGQSGSSWSNSELRTLLNGQFFETAFNREERGKILSRHLETETKWCSVLEKMSGGETEDKVSILSRDEIERYGLKSDDLAKFQTDFVGYYTDMINPSSPFYVRGEWMTRSPSQPPEGGRHETNLYCVMRGGGIEGKSLVDCGVVPVIRVPRSAVTVNRGTQS